jgi:hypothetical protein
MMYRTCAVHSAAALQIGHLFARKFEASVAMDVALAPMVDSANQLARVTDKFNNSRIFSDQQLSSTRRE